MGRMRGEDRTSGALFCYVDVEARIAANHPLRAMRRLTNAALADLDRAFSALYEGIGAHQSLHHFVANTHWSQEDLLRRVRTFVVPAIEKSGRISAWIVDDTGFPKKGVHSVGVARQYCGQLGKQDNCQIAVSLSVANEHASLPIAFRLYLPEDWAADPVRRERAGVPEDVVFKTKPQIALDQIKAARAEGVPEGVVLADAGYGTNTAFRTALTRMGVTYVVGVQSSARLWPPGSGPRPPKAWSGQGRPPTLMRRDAQNQPQSAEQLAKSLPADAWRDVAWREGVDKTLHSRFAVLRVRPASACQRAQPSAPTRATTPKPSFRRASAQADVPREGVSGFFLHGVRRAWQDLNLWLCLRRRGVAACGRSLTSCRNSQEKTGFRLEEEREYGRPRRL